MPAPLLDELRIPQRELDRLHREIEQYLAQYAPTAAPVLGRLDADALVRQAGIRLGPAPRQPGRTARALQRRPKPQSISVAEHLTLAARVIEIRGWTQRTLQDARGGVCILGAQTILVRLGYGDRALAVRAGDWLTRQLGSANTYWQWQDNRWRTREQVLDLLTTAAHDARKVGI
jgi:hypothetical protein